MSRKKKFTDRLPKLGNKLFQTDEKIGAAPGTLQHVGEKHLDEVQITVHDYAEDHVDEIHISNIEEAKPYLENPSKTWIKVCGLHDIEKLKSIWSYFDLHPLVQEDILNTSQRPKAELYDDNMFFVLRMLQYSDDGQQIDAEQISIVLGENYVLSFQETDKPYFAPVLDRMKIQNSRIRKLGADYLTYALIDTVVDYYFKVLGTVGERIENVEDELIEAPENETFQKIHALRREIIFFRKTVWPLRDTINSTIRDEPPFIDESVYVYLRDVYDHMVQIIDNIENYRDIILGMHDMYMSHVSNKMNEVMKVLTIIATIFIPLTFIAGIYGMNFDPSVSPYNMPELSWYWGYPAAWASMIIVAVVMISYFKRKNWL
ncbi:MAG: magnesium/cobalt transporter CorA [Balneolaceae bacterium]|nr:magnesium/cobalt transporter CorA [Balneolaceae bacterium]